MCLAMSVVGFVELRDVQGFRWAIVDFGGGAPRDLVWRMSPIKCRSVDYAMVHSRLCDLQGR